MRSIGELQGIGIKARLEIENKGPSGSELFVSFYSNDRLTQRVGRETPKRAIAVPRDEIFLSNAGCPVERRPVALPCYARVHHAVDRNAVPTQLAARGDKVPKAAARGRRGCRRRGRSLRRHDIAGRRINRARGAGESQNDRRGNGRRRAESFHLVLCPQPGRCDCAGLCRHHYSPPSESAQCPSAQPSNLLRVLSHNRCISLSGCSLFTTVGKNPALPDASAATPSVRSGVAIRPGHVTTSAAVQ
jgi:hypothetical protein